ncbi:MAG: ATP synthase F1 subunit delta [Candidatus Marinimicrobia bacterium]|nr:ATP synthase F1 subunit delta [Candidatus Neomarinimicrobiota bacterium]
MISAGQVKKLSRALLEVAGQTESTEELVSRAELLQGLFRKDRTFRHLMVTRRVDPEIKMQALRNAFGENLGPLEYELLAHLLRDHNGAQLHTVLEAVLRQAASQSTVLTLSVTSAAELPALQISEMGASLEKKTGRKVRVTGTVDPAVLGGVKLRLGNTLVDGTVARRLELVRRGLA